MLTYEVITLTSLKMEIHLRALANNLAAYVQELKA